MKLAIIEIMSIVDIRDSLAVTHSIPIPSFNVNSMFNSIEMNEKNYSCSLCCPKDRSNVCIAYITIFTQNNLFKDYIHSRKCGSVCYQQIH